MYLTFMGTDKKYLKLMLCAVLKYQREVWMNYEKYWFILRNQKSICKEY